MSSKNVKVLSVILALALVAGLGGCGKPSAAPAAPAPAAPAGSSAAAPAAPAVKEFALAKPVTIIAPAGAGGGLDMASRTVAKIFANESIVTQAISVENKPGGGQVTGTVEFATKHAKDDYSLLLASTPFILNYIKKDGNSPIGPNDVYPLVELQSDYGVIAVKADSPYNTLPELFDAIKADPAKVQLCGGGAPGTWDHLNSVLIALKCGVDISTMKYNTYDGGGEALTALLGGHATALTSDVSSIKQYLKAGEVKVLGVSSEERLSKDEVMKVVPTYKEQGIDVVTTNWRGVFAG
ncbi:MAG: tripartite tricarboxylate transporter substrate-binding protein, partial [Oscillospiraceae bacterium]